MIDTAHSGKRSPRGPRRLQSADALAQVDKEWSALNRRINLLLSRKFADAQDLQSAR